MKFGVCCSPDRSAAFAECGFDFVEWAVASNVGNVDADQFSALQRVTESLSVIPEVWNILLPGDLKVVGPDADNDVLKAYLDVALSRVRGLGGELVVFGSGRSRTIPDDIDRAVAELQFELSCRTIAQAAAENALTIVLEPLRKGETNLINTVDEGLELVNRIGHPSLELLADMYHMLDNDEPFSSVLPAASHLKHVHIASRPRFVPLDGEDLSDLNSFLGELKRAGYEGRLSFECRSDDVAEFGRGLDVLREAWAAA